MCRWWGGVAGAGRPPAAPAVAGGSTGAALNGEASVGGRDAGAVARRMPLGAWQEGWVCDAGAVARRSPVGV